MTSTLHITNGDIAADLLRRSDVGGEVIAWRDALHEGPVPAGLDLAALSRLRAQFVASEGWATPVAAESSFAERDRILQSAGHDEIVLWFEHDLYDQLQQLQLLDWFGSHPRKCALSLIEVGEFPGIEKFIGLGQLTPGQLASLWDVRRAIDEPLIRLARAAWAAFRSADPTEVERLTRTDTFLMPFLQDALLRHLEEFPSAEDGLGRTERQLLDAAMEPDRTLEHLFHAGQRREERAFMGDTIVRSRLRRLAMGRTPLLTGRSRRLSFAEEGKPFWSQEVVLTDVGRRVLDGTEDFVRLNGIDRWIGGVHLEGTDADWRWHRQERRLVRNAGR